VAQEDAEILIANRGASSAQWNRDRNATPNQKFRSSHDVYFLTDTKEAMQNKMNK